MSTVISHGVPTTLKANVVYALPSELTFVTAAAAVSTSLDGVAWTALANATTGAVTGSVFIKAAADTLVVTREATNMIQVPGSVSLPTAPVGQVLISQGDGVAPIFSASAVVNFFDARFALASSEGGVNIGIIFFSRNFTLAQLGNGTYVGDLTNINDSTVNTVGAVITGGGTFKVLARWNGTNWKVVAA
jgi:hypothetical protein